MKNLSIQKIVIFGYGSIGKRHYKILKKYILAKNIYIFTSQKLNLLNCFADLEELKNINPDYFIISTVTSDHIFKIRFIEKYFNNKIVLIEKPLFRNYINYKPQNNSYFINYNLRFSPSLNYLKKYLMKKKYFHAYVKCSSYLPNWRVNTNYKKSYSSSKELGGGVLLDLSHEIDYCYWLFGELKILSAINKKISNLDISSDDYLSVIFKSNKKLFVNLDINFFSRDIERSIVISGNNFSIKADLLNQIIFISDINKNKRISLKKISSDYTYTQTHLSILNNRFDKLCTYEDAMITMKIIKNIQKCQK